MSPFARRAQTLLTGSAEFMGVQVGKKVATGHFGDWRIPSFVVLWMRKNLFTERFQPMVDGSMF